MFDNYDDENTQNTKKTPIFIKAMEILTLSDKITDLIFSTVSETDNDIEQQMLKSTAQHIKENAMGIPAKISGAMAVDLYDLKMENAAIIRKLAREIATNCTGLKMYSFPETDYLNLLRAEIENFRVLFAEWVNTFNEWDYIIDRWGLFNPPGINYDDPDPDDDLPFDVDEFLDDI